MLKVQLIGLQTIVWKEVHRFSRIWIQTLIPPVITTALYFVIFGNLIGRYIPEISGYNYISFIVPGLVMMSVINGSFTNVAGGFFGAKIQHHIEELLVSPIPNVFILIGYLAGGIIRGVVVGLIVFIIAGFFTTIIIQHPLLMLLVAILSANLFSTAGMINAIYAKKFDDVNVIPTFILGPLTYLGGIFYSITLIPPFWQHISLFNPIFYIINAFRYSTLGISDVTIGNALVILLIANMVLFYIALHLLNRGYGIRS